MFFEIMDFNAITTFLKLTGPQITYLMVLYGTNIPFFGTTASKEG